MNRTRDLFDHDWRFYRGDIAIPETVKAGVLGGLADVVERKKAVHDLVAFVDKEHRATIDPARWPVVTLPHDWVVAEPFVNDPALTTHGFKPHGVGFYRKVFALGASLEGRKVVLEFDGVFRNCSIWCNGHHLADHRSGYTSFHVDLTDVARYGSEGLNCVLVRVDARAEEGWWYEGGGIYRHVWLTSTARVHVARWGTFVTTPRVTDAVATVQMETTVENETPVPADAVVSTVLVDPVGRKVAAGTSAVRLGADGRAVARQRLTVRRPVRWTLQAPALYRALTTVRVGPKVVDTYRTTFGIRTIRFDPARGFFLNGVHTPIKGTCNHQDFAGVGVALPDSLQAYKIDRLKEMGSNAYRCAHHPPAPELLEVCDRVGMLVLDENRRLDSSARGLEDLESMIRRDRNHPSVIIWGMENEERLEGTPMGARILDRLVRRAHRLDPTRPTIAAQNHGHVWLYQGKTDIAGFNYGHNHDKDVAYHREHPHQPVCATESNASVTSRGVYVADHARGYVDAWGDTMGTPPWPWNCGFHQPWQAYLANPFLTGIFIWSGFDYRGEPLPCKWPSVNSHYGIMDTCGFPKDGYWYHRAQFRPEPLLHVFPHWNNPVQGRGPVKVRALTNCDRVALFVNGAPAGLRAVAPGGVPEWLVDWAPGALVAVGYRDGAERIRTTVRTTGRPAAVHLEPARSVLAADGRDAMPVRVSIQDRSGQVVPTAGNLVRFSIAGPGTIIGVGNGDPASHEPDQADRRRAFNGWCLAIVQSSGRKGRIVVTARSAGLTSARCVLTAGGR